MTLNEFMKVVKATTVQFEERLADECDGEDEVDPEDLADVFSDLLREKAEDAIEEEIDALDFEAD